MTTTFTRSFDELLGWRQGIELRAEDLLRFLADHDLLDGGPASPLRVMRDRLSSDKLVVAFVAEFSRGKSELINAIFFADTGQRILPATPGRTTMSPVELGYEPTAAPGMALLPIETRLDGRTLSELRLQADMWQHQPLSVEHPEQLAKAMTEVKRTVWVSVDRARELGFWDDEAPQDNPPVSASGQVEVPAWRHVLINYPHPLLQQGLVVLDTPGLNAIGAEPELTLSLLPAAHATVFILAADTGVTKSDLTIWRDHLSTQGSARYVVLNKIDTLSDPLAGADEVEQHIRQQRSLAARTLEIEEASVFPISARQALIGRVSRSTGLYGASRLEALEQALREDLLPRRQAILQRVVREATDEVDLQVGRRLADRRRQLAEQMLELRGLRGKSGGKVKMMLQRVATETAEFEQCTSRLQALRVVHSRMLKDALSPLATERLRLEMAKMQAEMSASLLNLGAKRAFMALIDRLRQRVQMAQARTREIHEMLEASYGKLNAEFGFALAPAPPPGYESSLEELDMIGRNYSQYLGLSQAVRLANASFMEQFRRMLLSKLRVIFETASSQLELWSRANSNQIDEQLRERRASFRRRRESLERIQQAAGELEQRVAELESHDAQLSGLASQFQQLIGRLRESADPSVGRLGALHRSGLDPVGPMVDASSAEAMQAAGVEAPTTAAANESRPAPLDELPAADTHDDTHDDTRPASLHGDTRPASLDDETRPSAFDDETRPSALDEETRPAALDDEAPESPRRPRQAAGR